MGVGHGYESPKKTHRYSGHYTKKAMRAEQHGSGDIQIDLSMGSEERQNRDEAHGDDCFVGAHGCCASDAAHV